MSQKTRKIATSDEEGDSTRIDELQEQMKMLMKQVHVLQENNTMLQEELRKRGGTSNLLPSSSGATSATSAGGVPAVPVIGPGVADVLAASQVKVPSLKKLTAAAIKGFHEDYDEYLHVCPAVAVKKMVNCVSSLHLAQIADHSGKTIAELTALTDGEFSKCLKNILAPVDENEAHTRLVSIKMTSDDLLLTTVLSYHLEWDWEVSCLGDVHFQEKTLVKKYLRGLRPDALRIEVERDNPESIEDAKKRVLKLIDPLRAAKARAHLFATSANSNANTNTATPFTARSERNNGEKKHWSKDKKFGEDKSKSFSTDKNVGKIKCFSCGKLGHIKRNCPDAREEKKVGNQQELKSIRTDENHIISMKVDDLQTIKSDGLVRLPIVIFGLVGRLFLDSGASLSTIKESCVNKIMQIGQSVEIVQGPTIPIRCAAGLKSQLDGRYVTIPFQINFEDKVVMVEEKCFIVNEQEDEISFGLDAMRRWNLIQCLNVISLNPSRSTCCEEDEFLRAAEEEIVESIASVSNENINFDINEEFPERQKLQSLLESYRDVFGQIDDKGMKVPPMSVKIKEGAVRKSQSCRFVAPHLMVKLKEAIDDMLHGGVIEPTNTAGFASPLVLVAKPDGSIRVAVDYRDLNLSIEPFAGTIPDMKSMFSYVAGNDYYAKVDNISGYYQLNLCEADRDNTAIITPFGLFRFKRCPFGLSTAPGVYQNRMAEIVLRDLIPEVCVVFIDDTIIKGKSVDGFLVNLEQVLERMRKFNVKLKPSKCSFGYTSIEFVGHVFNQNGYYLSEKRKQEVLELKAPTDLKGLRRLLGLVNFFRDFIPNFSQMVKPITDLTARSGCYWNEEADQAWDRVKREVASAGILFHVEEEGELRVYTDASIVGIGGVLKQFRENVEVPIMFISKKFSSTAANWSTLEQECFGIFFTIMKLRSFLLGRKFVLFTDHRNLIYLQQSNIPKLVRWKLRLLEFDFVVKHIPGKENVVADSLSRIASMSVEVTNRQEESESETSQIEFIKSLHNSVVGHHGIIKMEKMLKAIGWKGSNIREDITTVVQQCLVCQKLKYRKQSVVETQVHTLQGSHPMKRVGIDAIGPLPKDESGNQYILTVVDEFSKFTTLYACKSVTAREYVDVLVKHVSLFGLMEQIRSDGGSQFTATISQEVAKYLGINHFIILPYHPQANGIVERRNGEVLKHLRAIVMERRVRNKWSHFLPIVQNVLNNSIDLSMNTSPSKLIFGDQIKTTVEWLTKKNIDQESRTIDSYISELNKVSEAICDASRKYVKQKLDQRVEKYMEIGREQSEFLVGDYVLVTYPVQPPDKLSPILRGPMIVIEKVSDGIYKCRDIISNKLKDYHVNRLREVKVNNDITPQELIEFASVDNEEYPVQEIVEHRGTGKANDPLEFRVRWEGYCPDDDSWLPYREVKELEALDRYEVLFPDVLKFVKKGKK